MTYVRSGCCRVRLACLSDDCLRVPRHSHQSALGIGLVFEVVIKRKAYTLRTPWDGDFEVHALFVQGDHVGRRRAPEIAIDLDVHEVGIRVVGIHMVHHIAFGLRIKTRALHGIFLPAGGTQNCKAAGACPKAYQIMPRLWHTPALTHSRSMLRSCLAYVRGLAALT